MGAEKNVLGGGGTGFTEEIVCSFYIAVAADDDSIGGSGQHAGVGIGGGEFGEEVPVFQEKEVPGPFVFCAGRAHSGVQECVKGIRGYGSIRIMTYACTGFNCGDGVHGAWGKGRAGSGRAAGRLGRGVEGHCDRDRQGKAAKTEGFLQDFVDKHNVTAAAAGEEPAPVRDSVYGSLYVNGAFGLMENLSGREWQGQISESAGGVFEDFCMEGLHNVLLIKSIRLLPGKNRIGEMVILLVQGMAGAEQGFRTAAADSRDELLKLVVR